MGTLIGLLVPVLTGALIGAVLTDIVGKRRWLSNARLESYTAVLAAFNSYVLAVDRYAKALRRGERAHLAAQSNPRIDPSATYPSIQDRFDEAQTAVQELKLAHERVALVRSRKGPDPASTLHPIGIRPLEELLDPPPKSMTGKPDVMMAMEASNHERTVRDARLQTHNFVRKGREALRVDVPVAEVFLEEGEPAPKRTVWERMRWKVRKWVNRLGD